MGNRAAERALSPHCHHGRGELSFDLSVQFLKSWGHLDTVLSLVQAVSSTEGLLWQPELLAHPRDSMLMARRADGTGSTTVALHHLVPLFRSVLQSQVSLASGTVVSFRWMV